MATATVVAVKGAVVDAPVVVGKMVVGVMDAEVEVATGVLVEDVVSGVVADVDGTSVACPVVEQATISSRAPTLNRIGIP